jgi:hypothetical protein
MGSGGGAGLDKLVNVSHCQHFDLFMQYSVFVVSGILYP